MTDHHETEGERVPALAARHGPPIFLLAASGLAFAGLRHLSWGTLEEPGPAFFPGLMAGLLAMLCLLLLWRERQAKRSDAAPWLWRPALALCLACLIFAACIDGVTLPVASLAIPPLGLPVAGSLALLASGFAAQDTRWGQLAGLAVILPLVFTLLLRFALGEPVPVAPWWLGF